MEKQEKRITYLGKLVSYHSEGKGNVIVLLHGFLESKTMWHFFSSQLSPNFRVVSIDLPGHGKTDSFSDSHTMKLMAEIVKAVLIKEGIEKCVMIGHSMGGYVTAEFAHLFSDQLLGIGLFHSQVSADNDEARKNRDRTIELIIKNKKSFIKNFIPDLFAPENIETFKDEIEKLKDEAIMMDKVAIVAALRGMKDRNDHEEMLKKIPFPVLFISGKKDVRIPAEKVLQQAGLPAHSEVLILGNVGHMGHLEAREKTLNFVRSFCERIFLENSGHNN